MIWGGFLSDLKSSARLLTHYRSPLVFLPAHSKETLTGFPFPQSFSSLPDVQDLGV